MLPMRRPDLLIVLLAYAVASFLHHAHNAELLDHYPNMPAWLSRGGVYVAWLLATAIGVLGYWLRRPVLMVIYGLYGIAVLAHYVLAPWSAHTSLMHLTIGLEAATAAALLATLFRPTRTSP